MYKKALIILFVVFWAVPALADMVVDTAWVRRYNSPADDWDRANAIAVDNSGNVYVTGESKGSGTDWDYATIKYYPNGDTAWVRRYNGPADSSDVTFAMAIDGYGNVYVGGYSQGIGSDFDYATIKYYSNGDTAWVRRYNGTGNGADVCPAIAVDGSGNVYVTGSSLCIGTGSDYATIKYDPNGNQLWLRTYNGPGNGSDGASGIALDDSGNVYVTGTSVGSGTGSDYATIKYDPDGNQLWVRRYDGPGNSSDNTCAMAIDGLGNVCVTGWSIGIGTYFDYATVKYDPNGNELWVARYDIGSTPGEYPHDIAADDSGNVYVTGWCYEEETGADFATMKYDPDGSQLWVRRYDGPVSGSEEGRSIAVDGSGNVYVTGYSRGEQGRANDYATVRYDPNGNQLWVTRYNGPVSYYDHPYAIAVDDSNNVYVTGESAGGGPAYDYATIKYVQADALRGDANGDGVINSTDVVYLINYLFIGGPAPEPWQAGDANCDGAINSSDAVYLINYLFIGGPPPGC
jgi:outer membrane protein assembly factor BamB